jgi:hypothetical protein
MIRVTDQGLRQHIADALQNRKGCVSLSKIRPESGLMRGLRVPLDPFFPATGSATSSPNDGTVDTPQLLVYFTGIHTGRLQRLKNTVQRSIGIPFVKQSPRCLPCPELLGQISPRCSCAQDPQNPVNNSSSIDWRPPAPTAVGLRKQRFDSTPLLLAKL